MDGLSAHQHGSLEKSFSPGNKAALYSSGTAANTADTDGGFSSESAWTCTGTPSLWINPNQPADHSNWLFGDVFGQIEAELLTDAWICLPSSSVLLTGNSGTLTHILRRKQESQLWGWTLGFTPSSTKYSPFPSEASPGFQLRSSSIPSICSTKTNRQLFGFIKERTHPKPLPLGSCEIMYSEQPGWNKHFHHARLNITTKMGCKIHILYVRTSTWTNPN